MVTVGDALADPLVGLGVLFESGVEDAAMLGFGFTDLLSSVALATTVPHGVGLRTGIVVCASAVLVMVALAPS